MKIVFLDKSTIGEDVSLSPIESLGELIIYDTTSPGEVFERVRDCEVLIVNKVIIGKEQMDASPNLKLICVAATGMNNVDIEYAASKNIQVRNSVGYSTESVAQVTLMHILNLVGHGIYFDDFVKSGKYSEGRIFTDVTNPFFELKGKKMGIIGMGNIGKRVAEITSVFGMEVSYYSTSGQNDFEKYPSVSLEKLLNESDIISIHSPLNAKTKNLIRYQELKKMKPAAYIINMGRGGIINEEDLVKSLNENVIAGAAIDVFEKEPIPKESVFLKIKNKEKLILSPHIAWTSKEARRLLIKEIEKNIIFFK